MYVAGSMCISYTLDKSFRSLGLSLVYPWQPYGCIKASLPRSKSTCLLLHGLKPKVLARASLQSSMEFPPQYLIRLYNLGGSS